MPHRTICLVCERKGTGFTVKEIRIQKEKLLWGYQMMDCDFYPEVGLVYLENPANPVSLTEWLKKNTKGALYIHSAYIYHFTAPGEWCQLIWEVDNDLSLPRIKNDIENREWDISGQYLHARTLNSLTKSEKGQLHEEVIRA